jgi:hypothetical protein
MDNTELKELFAKKAKAGDGLFAIAYALIDLSDSQEATAKSLHRLGMGNASTQFGAIESLGMQIEKAANIIGESFDGATVNVRKIKD